jgi:hypothetical protein
MSISLARTISLKAVVRGYQGDAIYAACNDGTLWQSTLSESQSWLQLPSVPQPAAGARNIILMSAARGPSMDDTLYCGL